MSENTFPGIAISIGEPSTEVMESMSKITRDWTMRAARGECGWVCADCCQNFPEGMPDACCHGHQGCTDIITRDKAVARTDTGDKQS